VVVTLPLAPMPHVDVASESVLDLHPAASAFPLLLLTSITTTQIHLVPENARIFGDAQPSGLQITYTSV
jgi:hypothetical protein